MSRTLSTATAGEEAAHGPLMRRAAVASLAVSIGLVLLKAIAYLLTNSVAMLASLADSALDLFSSSLNLIAIRSSLTPADEEHRWGHGKAEPLAGLGQGAFIAGSATFLVIQAINRFVLPEPLDHPLIGLIAMGVSIAATLILITYQRYVVKKTGSVAISADRMHYASDLITNIGVVLAIGLTKWFGWRLADPVIALVIAAILIGSAWGVFIQSYNQLMDRELPDSDRDKIKAIVMRNPEVRDLHDLRTRAAGVHTFIQFHIELDPAISITRAHEISDQVEKSVCAEFPNSEVIIHQDPQGLERPAGLSQS
ncbi:MAG TPA: cation diffusion facilitator family transporter [Rhizomicrobium sp.]|nr:cation diffusion facilitator family transporter [Rhizomicrobium sp.]